MAMISEKSTFKTHSKHFTYGMGTSIPNPWLRNTAYISSPNG